MKADLYNPKADPDIEHYPESIKLKVVRVKKKTKLNKKHAKRK